MTYSEFEKNAARKINQYASGVDGEALWAAVQPEIPTKGKRRGGFYWMLLTGLVLIIAAAFMFNINTPDSNSGTSELSVSAIPSEEPASNSNENDRITALEKRNNPADNTEVDQSEKTTEKTSNDFNPESNISIPATLASSKRTQKGNEKYKAVTTKTSENNPVVNTPDLGNSTTTEPVKPAISTDQTTDNSGLGSVVFSEEYPDEDLPASIIEPESSNFSQAEQEEMLTNESDSLNSLEEKIANIEDNKEKVGKKDELNRPPSRNLDLTFGFGLYGGISRSTADLKSRGADSTMYLQSRLNSEKQLETLHLGVEVIAQAENGVYFRTGVQYSRIARKFSTDAERTFFDTIPDGLQAIYINEMTMDTIKVYGEVIRKTTTTFNKNTYNYFHMLDVPLLAGYTFKSDQWSLGVEAGAVFNISNKSKGEIFDLNGDFYDLKTDNNDWYKTNVGVSLMAGLSAAYHLDYNFQVYVSPTFRMGSVFSTDKNPLKQSHASLGVNAGVRYFLD